MEVTPYRPEDLPGVYRVCLATGDAGEDATELHADPNLLGHVFVGPYVCLEPDHAFVLRAGPSVVGYALAALDTARFEEACEMSWWPPLRAMYPIRNDRRDADARLVRAIHEPERTPHRWTTDYPSHLHIDLLPSAQGRGYGRRLIDTVLTSLARNGSPGVHLGVSARNERAIGFYEHLGFRHLEREAEGGSIMGRSII